MGFDGTANFAYRPLAFYTRRTHCFRIFFLSTRYIGRYILAYLYRDILTRLRTIQQYEFGVYIVHVYRNVQFIFFPRKDDSEKTHRTHTSQKSRRRFFADEMERERETFSAVSVTHCLPGGTARLLSREDMLYRDGR